MPVANVLSIPPGVNSRIESVPPNPFDSVDTKRLPVLSKAKSAGPEFVKALGPANVLEVPPGVNLTIVWSEESAAKRLPALSKAKPKPCPGRVPKTLRVPPGVNSKIVLVKFGAPPTTKTLPEPSTAKSEAKKLLGRWPRVMRLPPGVISLIAACTVLPLPPKKFVATNRSPALLNANPRGNENVPRVFTCAPARLYSKILPCDGESGPLIEAKRFSSVAYTVVVGASASVRRTRMHQKHLAFRF